MKKEEEEEESGFYSTKRVDFYHNSLVLTFDSAVGPLCRCCTRCARFLAGTTISLEARHSPGPPSTRAASAQSRAALTSGTS